jgi:16S rRNA processing protein RimM
VFVECNNTGSFFFIENSLQKTISLRIRFEDMNTEEDADAIMGNDIYLPLKMLPNLPVTNSTFMKLLALKSKTNDSVLLENRIYKRYDRPTFEVLNGEVEILIPMIDHFLVKIDRDNKKKSGMEAGRVTKCLNGNPFSFSVLVTKKSEIANLHSYIYVPIQILA